MQLSAAYPLTVSLARNQVLNLDKARATRLRVSDGLAWVTIDGQLRDIVLQRGQSFVVDSDEKVVVFALDGPAAVELVAQ